MADQPQHGVVDSLRKMGVPQRVSPASHSRKDASSIKVAMNDLEDMEMGPDDGKSHQPLIMKTEPFVRGNPAPLGLLGFGMTTVMLMFVETKWAADGHFTPTVMVYAAFYGGLGQFIAGILELIKGNTFAGTAFSSYGAFWMGFFLLEWLSISYPATYHVSLTGKTLWCCLWATLTAGFFVVTLRKNVGLQLVFSSLVITFLLLAGGVYSPNSNKAAGYVGFFCGSCAIYTAFAELYVEELGFHLPGVRPTHWI